MNMVSDLAIKRREAAGTYPVYNCNNGNSTGYNTTKSYDYGPVFRDNTASGIKIIDHGSDNNNVLPSLCNISPTGKNKSNTYMYTKWTLWQLVYLVGMICLSENLVQSSMSSGLVALFISTTGAFFCTFHYSYGQWSKIQNLISACNQIHRDVFMGLIGSGLTRWIQISVWVYFLGTIGPISTFLLTFINAWFSLKETCSIRVLPVCFGYILCIFSSSKETYYIIIYALLILLNIICEWSMTSLSEKYLVTSSTSSRKDNDLFIMWIACVLSSIHAMLNSFTSSFFFFDSFSVINFIKYAILFGMIGFMNPLVSSASIDKKLTPVVRKQCVKFSSFLPLSLLGIGYFIGFTSFISFTLISGLICLGFGGILYTFFPMYEGNGMILDKTTLIPKHTLINQIYSVFQHLYDKEETRRILFFLFCNINFMFVEIIVGVWTNSLGLLSDAGHMFFDNGALVIGLIASYMSTWKADNSFTYGYERFRVLSGFTNSILLVFVASTIMLESLERFIEPPEVKTENLLITAVIGFFINVIGLVCFHDFSHGGVSCPHSHHIHNHNHSHSLSDDHFHVHKHHQVRNENMYGVYLHVLADTLGSIGVIISSLLIDHFGWNLADPICSMFISILIFGSVLPLLKQTAFELVQRVPVEIENDVSIALSTTNQLPDVVEIRLFHFWRYSPSSVVGTVHVVAKEDACEQYLLAQISPIFKKIGIGQLSIQIEKPSFHQSEFTKTITPSVELGSSANPSCCSVHHTH